MSAGLILKNVDDLSAHRLLDDTRHGRFHQTLMLRGECSRPCGIERNNSSMPIWPFNGDRKRAAQGARL